MKGIFFLAFLSVLALHAHAYIKIYSPESLKDQYVFKEIKHSYANFGRVPYGSLLGGRVFYFPDNSTFCTKNESVILDHEGDPDSDFSPIVMVDRGGCSFVRKTKNVQDIGGAMSLIVNNRPGQDPEDIVMIDDGMGMNVAIPTVIITKEFGDVLKKAVQECDENNRDPTNTKCFVVLLVNFEMENPDDRVEYDIWYTSGDVRALEYITNMRSYNEKLGKNALMTPHLVVRNCPYCSENDPDCRRYGEHLYCAGFSKVIELSGRDALTLGVDELCIYDIYKDDDNAKKWWDYMAGVYACRDGGFKQSCIDGVREAVSIETSKLMNCKYKETDMLQSEADNWLASGIPYSPAVVINNRVFRGTLDAENVFRAICAGLNETVAVCEVSRGSSGVGFSTILLIIVLVVLLNIVFIYLYRRHTKKEMREEMQLQISSMMSQYFALSDNSNKASAQGIMKT